MTLKKNTWRALLGPGYRRWAYNGKLYFHGYLISVPWFDFLLQLCHFRPLQLLGNYDVETFSCNCKNANHANNNSVIINKLRVGPLHCVQDGTIHFWRNKIASVPTAQQDPMYIHMNLYLQFEDNWLTSSTCCRHFNNDPFCPSSSEDADLVRDSIYRFLHQPISS